MISNTDIKSLQKALLDEPGSSALHYQLGLAYLSKQPAFSMLSESEAALFESLYKQTRQRTESMRVKIEGLTHSHSEETQSELKLATAIGLASPLQAAKARLLLILQNISSNDQKLLIELEETQAKLPIEVEETLEKLPSLKKYVHQKTWLIKGQLNNITITKKDYQWYLNLGNKEARDFLRKHYYYRGAGFTTASSWWKNKIETEHRPPLNELRALVPEMIKDKEKRLRKQLKEFEAQAIGEHAKLVTDFNKSVMTEVNRRQLALKPSLLRLKQGYAPILKKDSKNFLAANKAINKCNGSLKSSPHDMEALHVLGILYMLVGKFRENSDAEERIEQTKLLIESGLIKQSSASKTTKKSDGHWLESKSAQLLGAMGFRTLNTKSTADGGVDIYAFSDAPVISGKYIIQCKDWSQPVGEPILRDLYGLIIAEAANKGIVIATSGFTTSAINFARNKQLELIDGEQFEALLRQFALH